MLYIYLDFVSEQENYNKQSDLEILSERYSFADYENKYNEHSIIVVFDSICEKYTKEKYLFGLENEKLICKCIDRDTDKIIMERNI